MTLYTGNIEFTSVIKYLINISVATILYISVLYNSKKFDFFNYYAKALAFCSNIVLNCCIETRRVILKNIVDNYSFKTLQNDIEWGQYLAGLFEGDGCYNPKNGISISFHLRDLEDALKLATNFGYGNIYRITNKKAIEWKISNKAGVIKFISLIDGNLRTLHKINQNKINQIKATSSRFNFTFMQISPNISPINNTWWLSGFSDADSSFVIQVPQSRGEVRLLYKFNNSLKDLDILNQLSKQFGGNVYTRTHPNGDLSYYWSSNYSLDGIKAVYSYFDKYPLQSNKLQDFLIWREALNVILKNEHKTE